MIAFPNCKINLGLHILQKRPDGFHDIETVFHPIKLNDVLEIIQSEQSTSLKITGIAIDGPSNTNICMKAYELLAARFPRLPPAEIHLHKHIPAGAGLGGGSSDGSFTLLLLNRKFGLGLSQDQLMAFALKLGSDCPFFILNQTSIARGRGELLEPLPNDLSVYRFLLVNPQIHVSTASAFAGIKPDNARVPLKAIIEGGIDGWRGLLKNDFEDNIFKQHPEIAQIKQKLYESGAVYASMSGSGSTVYGIFRKQDTVVIDFPTHYFVAEG